MNFGSIYSYHLTYAREAKQNKNRVIEKIIVKRIVPIKLNPVQNSVLLE